MLLRPLLRARPSLQAASLGVCAPPLLFSGRLLSTAPVGAEATGSTLTPPVLPASTPPADLVTSVSPSLVHPDTSGIVVQHGLPDLSFAGPSFLAEGFPTWWPLLWPQYGLMRGVELLHTVGGLEWCGAVVCASVVLRAGTFFLFIRSNRTSALLQYHQEALAEYNKRMEAAKAAGADAPAQQALVKEYFTFMKSVGVNLFSGMMIPTFINVVIAGSYFTGLRKMAMQAHTIPGMLAPEATAGTFLTALHLPDPTFILPAASVVFSVGAIYATSNIQGYPQAGLTPGGQKLIFGTLSTLFNAVAISFPASVQIYLAVTSATMLLQQGALRVPLVLKTFGYPSGWPLPPEVIEARLAKAATNTPKTSFTEGMAAMKPLFKFSSSLAAGKFNVKDLKGGPQQSYLGFFGLSDPGVPPPPPPRKK